MFFKVAVNVTCLKENAATDAVVGKSPFAQIDGGAEAHAEVFSKGLVAPQIAACADFGCTPCHYEAK